LRVYKHNEVEAARRKINAQRKSRAIQFESAAFLFLATFSGTAAAFSLNKIRVAFVR